LELTHNYSIDHYELGNDFEAIHIESQKVYDHVKEKGAEKGPDNTLIVHDPDGHKYIIHPGNTEYPVKRVSLNVSFWLTFVHFTAVFRFKIWQYPKSSGKRSLA
jgi:hypothetical protein